AVGDVRREPGIPALLGIEVLSARERDLDAAREAGGGDVLERALHGLAVVVAAAQHELLRQRSARAYFVAQSRQGTRVVAGPALEAELLAERAGRDVGGEE